MLIIKLCYWYIENFLKIGRYKWKLLLSDDCRQGEAPGGSFLTTLCVQRLFLNMIHTWLSLRLIFMHRFYSFPLPVMKEKSLYTNWSWAILYGLIFLNPPRCFKCQHYGCSLPVMVPLTTYVVQNQTMTVNFMKKLNAVPAVKVTMQHILTHVQTESMKKKYFLLK